MGVIVDVIYLNRDGQPFDAMLNIEHHVAHRRAVATRAGGLELWREGKLLERAFPLRTR